MRNGLNWNLRRKIPFPDKALKMNSEKKRKKYETYAICVSLLRGSRLVRYQIQNRPRTSCRRSKKLARSKSEIIGRRGKKSIVLKMKIAAP